MKASGVKRRMSRPLLKLRQNGLAKPNSTLALLEFHWRWLFK